MEEMMLRDIYDVMHIYAIRNKEDVSGDEDGCYVGFKETIDGTTYSISMKTEYFGTVNHVEFDFPNRIPASKMKEASHVANDLNVQIRFGTFRLVEHNGRVRYCFDGILKHTRVDANYFDKILNLSKQTLKEYAPRLLALCE